jgi:hypothetical protein
MLVLICSFNTCTTTDLIYTILLSPVYFCNLETKVKNLATNYYIDFEVPDSPKFLFEIMMLDTQETNFRCH